MGGCLDLDPVTPGLPLLEFSVFMRWQSYEDEGACRHAKFAALEERFGWMMRQR